MAAKKPWYATAVRTKGKRSSLEAKVAADLEFRGLPAEYEPKDGRLTYMLEYIPDFRLPNGILVEVKGYFAPEDRTKMLRVKQANPEVDIRFVFGSDNKIHRNSMMRYSDWCEKHGFLWALKTIPEEWYHQ